jgi:UDP-N-acetylmuramyl pentapeptide phosphotransferase/UDP-N-acetylglucosamine-1-phosphate transferase
MSVGVLAVAGSVLLLSYGMTRYLCAVPATFAKLDHPNDRSLHAQPTPRTGGLAILGGGLAGILTMEGWQPAGIAFLTAADPVRAQMWIWVLGLAVLLGAVSFWDDRTGLAPAIRLGLHGLAAIVAVAGAGLSIATVPVPLGGIIALGNLAVPLTVLGLMWMANLYNFMDGMDGFAGGMTVMGFGLLSYLAWVSESYDLAGLAMLIAASTGGFLCMNLPPAGIFMGDVGSVPLGFLAGALSLIGVRDGVFDFWVPLLIFSPFIVDATVTLLRRLLRGVKVWQAHREHYYQRLVLAGWGHRTTVLAEYGLMLATGVTAVLYVRMTDFTRAAILVGWALAYVVLFCGVRHVESRGGSRKVKA